MDDPGLSNGDAPTRQRLVRMLRDPDGYFDEARRAARENARRQVTEQLDGASEPR